jgi:hypothetical protein
LIFITNIKADSKAVDDHFINFSITDEVFKQLIKPTARIDYEYLLN